MRSARSELQVETGPGDFFMHVFAVIPKHREQQAVFTAVRTAMLLKVNMVVGRLFRLVGSQLAAVFQDVMVCVSGGF